MNLVKHVAIGAGLLVGGLFALTAFLVLNPATRTWISAQANGQAPPSAAAPATPAKLSGLDFATSREVIGLNPAFVETKLGPAKYKQDYGSGLSGWGFEVGSCEVEYAIERGVKITGLAVTLAKGCAPPFKGVRGLEGAGVDDQTRFRDLTPRIDGSWRADCMGNCGNMRASVLMYYHAGSRAEDFLEVTLEVKVVGDDVVAAYGAWETALGIDPASDIDERSYACGIRAQDTAARVMRDLKIERIAVGYGFNPAVNLKCEAPAGASASAQTTPPAEDAVVNGVSRAWLIGSWAYGDMCETDVSVHYNADGTVNDFGANGRWTLKGDVVTQYIDEEYELGEEKPSVRYAKPDIRRFRIQRLGPRKARVGAGEDGRLLKCS